MNAIVTAATIRGRAALDEVRALFDQLYLIDSDIADLAEKGLATEWPYGLTLEEMQRVLHDRREAVLTKLENKGIRIAPDPTPVAPPVHDATETPAYDPRDISP
jgi:hypothetical protein